MLRLVRTIFGVIAALVLMALLFSAAFILSQSNPNVHIGWFFAAAGISYTMIVLLALHRV